MINLGKFKILENNITACDYEFILNKITQAITDKKGLLISPIASQTLVLAKENKMIRKVLDAFDYLVPDSQWVKHAINWLYGTKLKKRVYGPDLMLQICGLAQKKQWKIYLYGTDTETLTKLEHKLLQLYPKLLIAKTEPSKYRNLTERELIELQKKIKHSKAKVIFIAIGSPSQEILSERLAKHNKGLNNVIIPVGAAFDFISGVKKQAPQWLGNMGFEWLYRLLSEPSRLLKRYVYFGSVYILYVLAAVFHRRIRKILIFIIVPIILFVGFFLIIHQYTKISLFAFWDEPDFNDYWSFEGTRVYSFNPFYFFYVLLSKA